MSSQYRSAFDLSGKRAIVTGGAGILGVELCKGLAELGARVAVFDISESLSISAADMLASTYSTTSLGCACDVASPESVRSAVQRVLDAWGGIDILFNNAATKTGNLEAFLAPFEDY